MGSDDIQVQFHLADGEVTLTCGDRAFGRLADGLKGAADPDWYEAVVLAALAHTGDLGRAVDLAARLSPTPPPAGYAGEVVELWPADEPEGYAGPPGPPPRPGLIWKDGTSRWVRPAQASAPPGHPGRAATPSALVAANLPTPQEVDQLRGAEGKSGLAMQTKMDKRVEAIVLHAMGAGWHPSGTANSPEDVRGAVMLNGGERCAVLIDGKLMARDTYSVKPSAVRAKLVASSADPHSIVCQVALNYTPGKEGVYLWMGAPTTLSVASGRKIMDHAELSALGTPGGVRKLRSRVMGVIAGTDLKGYKAMEQQQAKERARKDAKSLSDIVGAAVKLGAEKGEVYADVVAQMTDDDRAELLKALQSKPKKP